MGWNSAPLQRKWERTLLRELDSRPGGSAKRKFEAKVWRQISYVGLEGEEVLDVTSVAAWRDVVDLDCEVYHADGAMTFEVGERALLHGKRGAVGTNNWS